MRRFVNKDCHNSQKMISICVAVVATLLVATTTTIQGKTFTIQATFQRNKHNHPVLDLSNATNGKAIILKPPKMLFLNFCLRQRTAVKVSNLRFSNGNDTEQVLVDVDSQLTGMFETPSSVDHDWNRFMSTGAFPRVVHLSTGWHYVKVKLRGASSDGIAVDTINIEVDDDLLTSDIFSCELTCIPDQKFNIRPRDEVTESSFIVQESYKTVCPEVDNVNVPIFNPYVTEYEITAALPQYRAFSNWRRENTTGCPHLSPIYWSFNNLELISMTRNAIRNDKAVLYFSPGEDSYSKFSLLLIPQFKLEGKSEGMVDSDMGTILKIKFKHLTSNVRITMKFIGRYRDFSEPELKFVTPSRPETEWNMRDFSWTDGQFNFIFLSLSSNTTSPLQLDHLFLERRPMLPDEILTIYKGDNVIVEAVFSDFWWLNPESMSVHLSSGETYNNASYFRIYRPIPWNSGYAQVFVLYQDGNARLLPVPPEGVDWIPFGSSVIIGQTDPTVVRPYASIKDVYINTDRIVIDIRYKDGGSSKVTLQSSLSETRAVVSDIFFTQNTRMFPFATFRSMYVSEGNTDVDHVSIDGIYPRHIMSNFGAVIGRSFVFHRKCMSRHLNLSPDIYIDIRSTSNRIQQMQLMQSESFQSLLQRIQNHRYRLWTPRLRNSMH